MGTWTEDVYYGITPKHLSAATDPDGRLRATFVNSRNTVQIDSIYTSNIQPIPSSVSYNYGQNISGAIGRIRSIDTVLTNDGKDCYYLPKTAKFDEYIIALEQVLFDYDKQSFKPAKVEKAEGARTILYYKLPGETSTLEVIKQYETDLKPAGYEPLFTAANDKLDDGFNRFVAQTFPTVKAAPGKKFLIVGHTDNAGDFALNQTLSKNRAAAVTVALAKDHGVPAASMISVGVGMAAPTASNTDEAGCAKNRRVEIVAM